MLWDGNTFLQANAEQCDRAGFKVTITRTGGAKCCPWCADRTGTWELKAAPDGVFGVHDNCKCMTEYTNSKGAVSRRVGRSRFVDVPYEPPHRMTAEEARAKGGFSQPRRLTGAANGGIMSSRYYEDINAFTGADKIEKVTKELLQQAISVIPEQLQKELSEYVSRLYIGDNNCRSAFSPDTREIRLNPQTGNQSIIHELGHAFGEMIGAYNDPEFIEILSEGLYLNDWGEVIYDGGDKAHDNRIAYAIESPKFIRSYQGRIYPPNEDEIITDSPISPEWLKEYISVGFDAYFRTPDLLKEKDPKLYSYLEKKINDRITRRV